MTSQLIYSTIASLDGYVEHRGGGIEWGAPDEEVHAFINELERPVRTYLYGRRMYETMRYWEDVPIDGSQSAASRDFTAIWRAAEKVVYSRTLGTVSSDRTRIERDFDAVRVQQLKARADHDLTIGGAALAAQAIEAGLVDELRLFVVPVVLGGGKQWLPDDVRLDLELIDVERFAEGTVYLRYHLITTAAV